MEYTMNTIAGKWKLVILWHIYDNEVIRFNELMRSVNGITHKMLSNQLKELVNDDIIHKEIYKEVPPKVEYSLTEKGKTLIPIMDLLFDWGKKNRPII
ncbi:helix-turn-helix transcriptional regulator [Acidaminobacter sp. JC074]|uniref:winged helix-turn-helix transcriptional regulator n=1 Tax=Acidaminobacter sp. JC074 TaxID=2530199 RepID=UPI001F0D705F|nr:helix-turn-helix domain-containing protein [Acidaminobacter sp. JC074]MCH4888154.1 helix-turn-helix transcriptional regulator [Acidaminobacter sp. JC074]